MQLRSSWWWTKWCPKHVERNNVNKILWILKQSTSSWRFYSRMNEWLNEWKECGARMEWYWQGKSKAPSKKILSHCHFFHYKSHMELSAIAPGDPHWQLLPMCMHHWLIFQCAKTTFSYTHIYIKIAACFSTLSRHFQIGMWKDYMYCHAIWLFTEQSQMYVTQHLNHVEWIAPKTLKPIFFLQIFELQGNNSINFIS